MAIRVRKDGSMICAAHSAPEPGDTYIDDGLHYEMSQVHGVITSHPMPEHEADPRWWWKGQSGQLSEAQAEIARLTADLEFWMGDHDKRWVAQMARAEKAEAEVTRLTAENAQLRHDYNIASELVSLKEERAEKAEAERDAIAVAAFEAAAEMAVAVLIKDPRSDTKRRRVGPALRALTPADAKASLDRMLRQGAPAAQPVAQEPVAWLTRWLESPCYNVCSQDFVGGDGWSTAIAVYAHPATPAPVEAGLALHVYDGDGWHEFSDMRAAIDHADASIQRAREYCDPEWPSWVEEIAIYAATSGAETPDDGFCICVATEVDLREPDEGSDCDYFCDYAMKPAGNPVSPALRAQPAPVGRERINRRDAPDAAVEDDEPDRRGEGAA